ncbi:MAG: ATP-binding protein [Nanoarchaeota archaeon]|nr:ATP-binding protein [Nanoarchaeota archaeon]
MVLINSIYAQDKQELFTNRKKELALIDLTIDGFLKKRTRKHLAFLGLRRIGKSLILFEFIKRNKKDVIISHIDLKKLSMEPQFFAVEYIKKILQWTLDEKEEDLLVLANKLKNENIFNQLNVFLRDLKERNNLKLINFAFSFPEILSQALNKKIVVCIDEFQEILGVNRYKDINNIIDIFRTALQSQSNTLYFITGSIITTMEKICLENKSALFLHFDNVVNLYNFTKEDSFHLMKKIFKREEIEIHGEDILLQLLRLSQGHVFYLTIICEKISELKKLFGFTIDESLVKKAFLIELTDKNARLYNYFNYIFENSLEKARGKAGLKSILLKIAERERATVSELCLDLNKEAGEMHTLLKRLMETDLIIKKERYYFYRDSLLRKWVRLFYLGSDVDTKISNKNIEELFSQLEEKYQRISSELGKAKEYEYKIKLEKEFNLKLENYNKDNIEFDLVGKKNNIYHIFEIKHRNKPTNYQDIKKFLEKINKSEFKTKKKRLFFISKSSFTKEAEKLMKKNKIERF